MRSIDAMRAAVLFILAMNCIPACADKYRLPGAEGTPEQRAVIEQINQSADARAEGNAQQSKAAAEIAVVSARRTHSHELEGYALHNLAMADIALGHLDEAARSLRQARLLFEMEGNLAGQADMRLAQAELARASGDSPQAERLLASSQRLSEAAGNRASMLNAASVAFESTNSARTASGKEQVDALRKDAVAANVPAVESLALRREAEVAKAAGRFDEAERLLRQSLDVARTAGDHEAQSHCLRALGELELARAQSSAASRYFSEALEQARLGGHRGAEGNALLRIAEMQGKVGDTEKEGAAAQGALAAFQAIHQQLGIGLAQLQIGESAWRRGRVADAEIRIRESIASFMAAESKSNEARARLRLSALLRAKDTTAAQAEVGRALALYTGLHDEVGEAGADMELGRILGAQSRFDEAITRFKQAREIYVRHGQRDGIASADLDIGTSSNLLKRYDAGESASRAALQFYTKMNYPSEQASAEYQVGIALAGSGGLAAARALLAKSAERTRHFPNSYQAVSSLVAVSQVAELQEDYPGAQAAARDALVLASKSANQQGMQMARTQLQRLEGKGR